jgi:uncharacterized SAM-binding protein YcdF (DUF218 family)
MRRWLLAASLLVAVVVAFGQAGYFLTLPAQRPEHADLMVVLGGDVGDRSLTAARLYRQGLAGRILLTGVEGRPSEVREHYQNWRAQFLMKAGVSPDAILFDSTSANSMEEAVNARRLMEQKGWRSVIVVSDPHHMRRLSWAWGRVFAESGLQFRLVATSPDWWKPDRWWLDEKSAQAVITEYIKLVYYLAVK